MSEDITYLPGWTEDATSLRAARAHEDRRQALAAAALRYNDPGVCSPSMIVANARYFERYLSGDLPVDSAVTQRAERWLGEHEHDTTVTDTYLLISDMAHEIDLLMRGAK